MARREAPVLIGSDQDAYLGIPVQDMLDTIPAYDERKKIFARDSLASVDGFRCLVSLVYEFLFGLRY